MPRTRTVRADLVIVAGLVAATQMSWGVVIPVMPVLAETLDASVTDLGLLIALFGLGRLFANLPAGRLAERVNQKWLLLVSVVAVVAFMALSGFVTDLNQLFVLRVLTGIGGGFAVTVGNAFIASTTAPERRGRALGTLHAFQLAGGALGPSVGGFVAAWSGPTAAFLVSGAAAAAFAIAGVFWLRSPQRQHPSESIAAGEAPRRRQWLLRDRSMLAICIVGFAVFFARFGGQQFLVPVLAYDQAGMTEAQLGLVLGVIAGLNIGLIGVAGWFTDKYGRKAVIIPAMLISSLAFVGYSFASTLGAFIVVSAVVGLFTSIAAPAQVAYLADIAPVARQGSAVGIYRTFGDLAALIGPVVLGVLVEHHGGWAGVVTVSACGTVAAIWFWLRARRTRPVPQPEPAEQATAAVAA
ncbi:MFS transporter [Pseudactinotalea sp.]|uniref:MFS transporter n=1 Tax=Pseudactinotalea sp. TaxID=1926260 RepID=UPI003B3A2A97